MLFGCAYLVTYSLFPDKRVNENIKQGSPLKTNIKYTQSWPKIWTNTNDPVELASSIVKSDAYSLNKFDKAQKYSVNT